MRTTEGTFPYWNTIDNRLVADEFFRPSYTTGISAKGALTNKIQYNLALGNNLSQLGVDAGQLDDGINTFSGMVAWFPTTGEYGINSSFGDFEKHQKVATRFAGHFSHSNDNGFQLQASAMVLPQTLQVYTTYSKVFGEYGDPWDFRVGLNWYPWRAHSVRLNMEYIQTEGSPVGGLSLPLPVGATGGIFYTNFMINF